MPSNSSSTMPDAIVSVSPDPVSSSDAAGGRGQRVRADQRSASSASGTNGSKKSVNFRNLTRTYLIPTLDEFTEDEYSRMFLTKQDMNRIRQDVVESIAAMRIGQNGLCSRGLETMRSQSQLEKVKSNRLQVLNAVLDEQDRQWDKYDDIVDHEKISQLSKRCSSSAIEDAIARAVEASR